MNAPYFSVKQQLMIDLLSQRRELVCARKYSRWLSVTMSGLTEKTCGLLMQRGSKTGFTEVVPFIITIFIIMGINVCTAMCSYIYGCLLYSI